MSDHLPERKDVKDAPTRLPGAESTAIPRQVGDAVPAADIAEPPRTLSIGDLKEPAEVDRLIETQVAAAADRNIAYRILHDVFRQSWHRVKHELAEPQSSTPRQKQVRQGLAAQLIAYRNWSYPLVLDEAGKEVNEETKRTTGYTGIKNKGSDALTSDVDLMLQGDATELVVGRFNAAFRAGKGTGHVWDFEPGVVYDVNAYELGYVPDPDRGVETKDEKRGAVKVPLKQGARDIRPQGGISNQRLIEQDRDNQSAAALVKARVHMTGREWASYTAAVSRTAPDTIATLFAANDKFAEYYKAIAEGLLGPTAPAFNPESPEALDKSGMGLLEGLAIKRVHGADAKETKETKDDPAVANALMAASNREAEKLLRSQVFVQRERLDALIKRQNAERADVDAVRQLEAEINAALVELRVVGAKVQTFANEAYFTDAALQHAVVGIQAEQGIQLSKADGMNVVIENMADALKELGRYPDPDEALYKAAKYMLRLADAARNMGYGYIGAVQLLYDAGRKGSVDIKNRKAVDEKGESKATQTGREVRPKLGPDLLRATPRYSGDAMRNAVIDAGSSVQQEYHAELRVRVGADEKPGTTAARAAETASTPSRPTLRKADYATEEAAAGNPRNEPLDSVHPRDAALAEDAAAKLREVKDVAKS
jgi:hypothetical protein